MMEPLYQLFKRQVSGVTLLPERDITDEELIEQVASGTLRFVICPENTVMVYKRFFLNIDSRVIAHPLYSYGWATGKHSDSLRLFLNQWIEQIRNDRSLKKIYLEYFSNQKVVNNLKSEYVSLRGTKLSPFDRDLRTMSSWIRWDWRLLASLVYHESNFRTGQISSKNAMGLMQLIPETAAKMGVDSVSSLSQQLSAGVRYLKHINDLLPDSITDPVERISFILAAYNVGIGRVLKARDKAIQYGKNPNRWHGSVDYYLLRRSRKDPHNASGESDGFSGDYKTEGYVDDILNRYYHYRNLIPE
jgi:membrane-bound lytic murein transglycosylase F